MVVSGKYLCEKEREKKHFVYKNGVWFKILFLDVVSGNLENVSGEWVVLLIPIMKF